MAYKLSSRSRSRLSGVHPNLVKVVMRAIELTLTDFTVLEGLRTKEKQAEYIKRGVSKTMHSKHLRQTDGFGHAVDLGPLVDGKISWEWGQAYDDVSSAMKKAATELGLKIQWGGDWKSFKDGPHYELVP
ncbi:hypothetical protein C4J81_11510 [Deltaproteobacteria bacterium Smac51]|nr:hypothetical protein C4J81_11510 [Deltaproteobacteria bacterium Smac51]